MAATRKPLRLSSYLPAFLVLVAAALACLAVARLAVLQIEDQSRLDVERVLSVDGQDWAEVTVDGLQIALSGRAPDEATRFRALSVAGTAVDASRVRDQMDVEHPDPIEPPRFSIEILRNDDGIALFGLIPKSVSREALITRATVIAQEGEITDLMETADFPVPTNWQAAVDYSFDALEELPRSKISVAADRIAITATTESAQVQRRTETTLTRLAPAGVAVELNLSAPRPVIAPFTLRFVIDENGPRFDACSADSNRARNQIVAAAREVGLDGAAICTVGMGVPSTRWAEAAEMSIAALGELGQGSLTFANADITLIASDSTSQELFDQVVGQLENQLPDVFSLHSTLPESVEIDGSGDGRGTPEFIATHSPEGLVQLRGRVSDASERDAVESFAQARFGVNNVTPATRLDPELPEGWPVRVLAGLEALSLLSNGALVVQPDFIELRGDTGNENAAADISRLLSARLGEGNDYSLDINYRPALDPQLSIPTPEECVGDINAALAASKITFAPGSAEIEASAGDTIDQIAEILRECSDVAMEIGGHTDSQGRESMNLSLSQSRADAVLNAIMARRVLTSALTAQGYGETQPIADNETEEGRETNRRITFTLTGGTSDEEVASDEVVTLSTQDDPEPVSEEDPVEEEAQAEEPSE